MQRNYPEIRFIASIIAFLGYCPFPEATNLAERIILFRTRQGLSQRKLAEKLGIDLSTDTSWETGRHRPSESHIKILERIGILG